MSVTDSPDGTHKEHRHVSNEPETRLQLWDSIELLAPYRKTDSTGKSVRVLLAEDNLIDQMSIRRLLEKEGLEVTLVSDGRQAVDRFEFGLFDLVLLDILMPDMDGFEAALRIREKERQAGGRIPIIALTSYSLRAVYDKCKSVGMSGYLSKPVGSSDLRKLFSALIPATFERPER